jgi:drug/metabolite transporter (DMT)-like permease
VSQSSLQLPARPHLGLSNEAVALIVLVFGAATIGFAPILVRLTETGPAAAGFWRLLFALPALAVMDFAIRRHDPQSANGLGIGIVAGMLFAGDLAFWHYGVALTSVANATVLSNLSPIVVAVMAWVIFKDRPRPAFALGVLMGIAGACGMALFADRAPGQNSLAGDAFAAATALWYGLYLLAVNIGRRTMPASTIMLYSTAAGAPILLLVALALGEDIIPRGPAGWAACIGLGVVHVLGQGAIAWALGRLGAPLASVCILVQPVVAAVAGALLFGELINSAQIVSGVFALAGICVARIAASPRRSPAADPEPSPVAG